MSTFDYAPYAAGLPADPGPAGGAVTNLALYDAPARSGTPHNTGAAARVSAGVYRFTVSDVLVPAGRYWARVTWTPATGDPPVEDDLRAPVDLPARDDLIVSPETLAVRLGLPLPLDDAIRTTLGDAIAGAQDDAEAYLGRAIIPRVITEQHPWPVSERDLFEQPVREVLGEAEVTDTSGWPTGYWAVTYRGGLDARTDAQLGPIRRAVTEAAASSDAGFALWSTAGAGAATDGTGARSVHTVTAEGQSVTWDVTRPGRGPGGSPPPSDAVGGPVRWSSIGRWRLKGRRVYSAPAAPVTPFGGLGGYGSQFGRSGRYW